MSLRRRSKMLGADQSSALASVGQLPTVRTGTTIGRHVVLSVLGEGAMGIVYEAYDPELDRKLAIKLVRAVAGPRATGSVAHAVARDHDRMVAEARALAQISHPNVISIYDVGVFGEHVYLAMELIPGQTLQAWLRSKQRPITRIVGVMLQAGRGLVAVHDAGLTHRDFKPENVLLGADGRVCIADFGLASPEHSSTRRSDGPAFTLDAPVAEGSVLQKTLEAWQQRKRLRDASTRSTTNLRAGTPSYMAPEVHLGVAADAHSDQFSYCVCFFEALTGTRPFRSGSQQGFVTDIQQRRIRANKHQLARMPGPLRRLIFRGLAARATDRHRSMRPLLQAIESYAETPARRRRRLGQAGASLLSLGAAALVLQPQFDDPPDCDAPSRYSAREWQDHTRTKLAALFESIQPDPARSGWTTLQSALDAHVESWQRLRIELCQQSGAIGRDDFEQRKLLDLRHACAGAAQLARAALIDHLLEATPTALDHAPEAVFELFDIGQCYDPSYLDTRLVQPKPGQQAARVADFRRRLATLVSLRTTAQYQRGLALGAQLSGVLARELPDYLPVHAELEVELAQLSLDAMLIRRSIEHARRATRIARASHHDRVAVRAAVIALQSDGYHAQNASSMDTLGPRISAWITSAGSPLELRAEFARAQSLVAVPGESQADQVEYARLAYELRRELHPLDHPDLAVDAMNFGLNLINSGNIAGGIRMYEESIEIQERIFGGKHPSLALMLVNLGASYRLHQGRYKAALDTHLRALDIYHEVFGALSPASVPAYNEVAASSIGAGRFELAVELAREFQDIQERLGHPGHRSADWADTHLALVALELDAPQRALEHAARAIARSEALGKRAHGALRRASLVSAVAKVRTGAAATEIHRDLDRADRLAPEGPPWLLSQLVFRGEILAALGDIEGARTSYRAALRRALRYADGPSTLMWRPHYFLARLEHQQSNSAKALEHARWATELTNRAFGPAHVYARRCAGLLEDIERDNNL